MAHRTQLHLGDDARAVIDLSPSDSVPRLQSLSDRANLVLCRYAIGTAEACPEFSEAEWLAICDAAKGIWTSSEIDAPTFLWQEIMDYEGLGQKWSIDQAALVGSLSGLSTLAAWAVADVVASYWSREGMQESPGEAILQAGANLESESD